MLFSHRLAPPFVTAQAHNPSSRFSGHDVRLSARAKIPYGRACPPRTMAPSAPPSAMIPLYYLLLCRLPTSLNSMINENSSDSGDPAWALRPSLHEMQVQGALEMSYHVAAYKKRQTDTIHPIVTRAIASMLPGNEITNREVALILFGLHEREDNRVVRLFRNAERPLKLSTAAVYIQRLLHSKKLAPSEGGRLWYLVLLYSSAMGVVAEYFRNNGGVDFASFEAALLGMRETACVHFVSALEESIAKTSKLPLERYPMNSVLQLMDCVAFVHWRESKIKRNPLVSIRCLIDLTPNFDQYAFDE